MTKILIPVELTFSIINEASASMINSLHSLIGKPLVNEGDLNPYRTLLNDLVYGQEGFDRQSPLAVSSDIDHIQYITVSDISLIVALGGDVIDLPVFFELTTDPETTDCPFSTTSPPEKWSTWGTFGESHKPVKLGNKWYRSNNVGASGQPMAASQWIPVTRNYTLTLPEYQDIQKENSPLVP